MTKNCGAKSYKAYRYSGTYPLFFDSDIANNKNYDGETLKGYPLIPNNSTNL